MVFVIIVEILHAFIMMKVILQQGGLDLDRKKDNLINKYNSDFSAPKILFKEQDSSKCI